MKMSFYLSALLLFSFNAFTQSIAEEIRGKVIDKTTQQPLTGAKITLLETEPLKGAISNERGEFLIEDVVLGRYDVSVSLLGYTTYISARVEVKSGEETLLEISLTESDLELGKVVVSSDQRGVTNEAALVSSKSLKVEELSRIPGGIDDPARMVRKFPGVSPTASITVNELNIRGNAPRAIRWRLDDIDIYNPNHFGTLGGSGGGLTIFCQRLLTNTDFYSGAFPADYGNVIGGVFDVRFRNGNAQKRQHYLQLSFLGVDLATEGPIGNKGNASYIINYRYSSTGVLDRFLDLGGIPVFQDLSFKVHFKTKNNGTFNIYGIGGNSTMVNIPVMDTVKWSEGVSNFGGLTRMISGTGGFSYIHPLNEKSYLKTSVIATGARINEQRYYQNKDLVTADTTRSQFDKDYRISWHSLFNHKFSRRHTHRSGFMIHSLNSDVSYVRGKEDSLDLGRTLTDTVRYGSGSSWLMQVYSRSQFYLNNKWQLNVGVHAMYLLLSNEVSFEPRVGIRYQINNKRSLNFGYGLHSQMEPFFSYISLQYDETLNQRVRYNDDLKFNKAHHFVLGYYDQLNERWRLGVETYYQHQYNLVVGKDIPISRIGGYDINFEGIDLDNGGTGQNYGVEVAIERALNKGYYILANTSIFESNYTTNDGITRPSMFNGNYVVNLVGGKEWQIGKKKRKTNFISFNISTTYSGSQYFTPLDLEASIEKGYPYTDYQNPNSMRQDPLFFVDASVIFKRNRKKSNSQLTLQMNNLLNQKPIIGTTFDRDNGEMDFLYGTGFLPILSWRISF